MTMKIEMQLQRNMSRRWRDKMQRKRGCVVCHFHFVDCEFSVVFFIASFTCIVHLPMTPFLFIFRQWNRMICGKFILFTANLNRQLPRLSISILKYIRKHRYTFLPSFSIGEEKEEKKLNGKHVRNTVIVNTIWQFFRAILLLDIDKVTSSTTEQKYMRKQKEEIAYSIWFWTSFNGSEILCGMTNKLTTTKWNEKCRNKFPWKFHWFAFIDHRLRMHGDSGRCSSSRWTITYTAHISDEMIFSGYRETN